METYAAPAMPSNETERLGALRALDILDTPAEEAFDRLTRLAALIFDVPISVLSLVDSSRQWFKSSVGLSIAETSREISFCGHAILNSEPLVVPETRSDPRFARNPLVTGDPGVRFYAGAPLDLGQDRRIGVLCLVDRRPREFGPRQLETLGLLAEQALDALRLRSMNRELRYAHASLEALLQASPNAMLVHDGDAIVFANRAAARLLGRGPEVRLAGRSLLGFAADEPARAALAAMIRGVDRGAESPAVDVVLAGGAGPIVAEAQARKVLFNHKAMTLSTLHDVTGLRDRQRSLLKDANTDELTGLPRRQVFEASARELARSPARRFSLAFLDLDHFKSVNDRFGHVEGDRVLKAVAQALMRLCRKGDGPARWGGEELAVLLPDCPLSNALEFAERVRREVEGLRGMPCRVTLSAGVAEHRAGEDVESLLARADQALYMAKSLGRNRVQAAAG